MKLIGLSILFGIVGFILALLIGVDGSTGEENFIFAMWLIGFLSPSIYVLDKLYKKVKDK
ncbi:hypothetical protein HMPREF1982_02146 [Clostridiales bacterium oral taxon 876 str. F0540]|nr:hypothetical protein HMPREF1982_02146 [Clostridiales bacterium oral taxon 876 str. F0540]